MGKIIYTAVARHSRREVVKQKNKRYKRYPSVGETKIILSAEERHTNCLQSFLDRAQVSSFRLHPFSGKSGHYRESSLHISVDVLYFNFSALLDEILLTLCSLQGFARSFPMPTITSHHTHSLSVNFHEEQYRL